MAGPGPEFAVYRFGNARPLARAWTDGGQDVTDLVREKDRRTVNPGRRLPYAGYGVPHTLTLDLGTVRTDGPLTLIWDGWTSFSTSSTHAEAARDGVRLQIPVLEAPDGKGGWTTIVEDVGVPAGKPKTIFTDLTGMLSPGTRTVRLRTNMLVYWDRIRVATEPMEALPISIDTLETLGAELAPFGYPMATTPDGSPPYGYDYDDVSHTVPWPPQPGMYTRFGPVESLLERADDRFVAMHHGEQISLTFEAPPEARGSWQTDYILLVDGYMKEIVQQDPILSRLEPLPFRDMPHYPYEAPVSYESDEGRRQYAEEFNTRPVGRR